MSWRQLFSGSRFIFWALTPVLLLCALALFFAVDFSSPPRAAAGILIEVFILSLILGLCNPRRNEWALRIVTGTVALLFVAYLGEEIWRRKLLPFVGGGGVESALAAAAGLFFIGRPCLKFTLCGFDAWRDEDPDRDPPPGSDFRSDDLE
jgi:hypothetical protein